MRQAKHGDTVKVHYRGKLHDGSEFDTSFDRERHSSDWFSARGSCWRQPRGRPIGPSLVS